MALETVEECKAHAYDVFGAMQKLQETDEVKQFLALQAELIATNDKIVELSKPADEAPAEPAVADVVEAEPVEAPAETPAE